MPLKKIGRKQFALGYAAKSNLSLADLIRLGLYPVPCDCGEGSCRGFQMITDSTPFIAEVERFIGKSYVKRLYDESHER